MKWFNRISILLLTSAVILCGNSAVNAALNEQSEIAVSKAGRLVLERHQEEGMLAREDILFMEKDGAKNIIFESEGRAIEQVLLTDFDGNGIADLLIVMDLGGSAGLKELALLQSQNGRFNLIWEETGFSAGKVAIKDFDRDGRSDLAIDFFTDDEPPKEARVIYSFENGKMVLKMKTLPDKAG